MKWWWTSSLFLLLGAGVVWAQSVNDLFNQSVAAGTSYRTAYNQYVQAKNQYLQYGTGVTRTAAIDRTNAVLVARNNWLISYMKYLRQSLADATNIANYPTTVTYLDLETRTNDLSGLTDLGTGPNFADINTRSKDWEKGLEQLDKLIDAARLQVAAARLANFQNQVGGYLAEKEQATATPSASVQTTLILIRDKLTESINLRQKVDQQLSSYRTGYWS